MKLPLLISLPHAGLEIPPEAAPYCRLSREEIIRDGDEGAAEIYALRDEVEIFITTPVARAVIDLNRAPDDRRLDGVVKTHTVWNEPVYSEFPPERTVQTLIEKYHRPYHESLRNAAFAKRAFLGLDCHTMLAEAPPLGDNPGEPRPFICLGDLNGASLPAPWMRRLVESIEEVFGFSPAVNTPFQGGFITRSHSNEMPWAQVEISRSPFLPDREKRKKWKETFIRFCDRVWETPRISGP